ncbi:hypothetical protein OQA88_3309 [Cercophora sp. LCS_1]
MPCSLCQSLARPPPAESITVTADHTDLIATATTCAACKTLLSIITDANLDSISSISITLEAADFCLFRITTKTASNRPLTIDIHFLPFEGLTAAQLKEVKANSRDPFAGIRSPYTDSASSSSWVQSRMSACDAHGCRPPPEARSVDDVTCESGDEETNRVVLDDHMEERKGWLAVKEWISTRHPSYFFVGGSEAEDSLVGRGWIYQERLLCSRVLHFGHSDLYWECNVEVGCQCGEWRHTGSRHASAQFPKATHARTVGALEAGDITPLRHRWQRIVTEFSSMAVTFESDRLSAVAGVARQLASRVKGGLGYVMGVWREFLFLHLLWHVTPWKVKTGGERWVYPRPLDSLGRTMPPSWTWASVGNFVQYEMEDPGRDVASFEKDTPRDPVIVEVPWAEGEGDRLLGRTTGDLVVRGHLTETQFLRYHTAEGLQYGVSRADGNQFYEVRLDAFPEDDTRWEQIEPVWPGPPEEDSERWVRYAWWEPEPMTDKDRVLLDWQRSPLKTIRDGFQTCEEFSEGAWRLFIRRWCGTVAYDISLVLIRVSEAPEKFIRVGILLCPPERLPIYKEDDMDARDVILV